MTRQITLLTTIKRITCRKVRNAAQRNELSTRKSIPFSVTEIQNTRENYYIYIVISILSVVKKSRGLKSENQKQ